MTVPPPVEPYPSTKIVAAVVGVNAEGVCGLPEPSVLVLDGLLPAEVVSKSPVPLEYSIAATNGVVPVQVIVNELAPELEMVFTWKIRPTVLPVGARIEPSAT